MREREGENVGGGRGEQSIHICINDLPPIFKEKAVNKCWTQYSLSISRHTHQQALTAQLRCQLKAYLQRAN